MSKKIIITGGAGFIGSHVVRLFVNKYPDYTIVNLDALTYAGNLENLKDIEDKPNYYFEKVNILDAEAVKGVFEKYDATDVIHSLNIGDNKPIKLCLIKKSRTA